MFQKKRKWTAEEKEKLETEMEGQIHIYIEADRIASEAVWEALDKIEKHSEEKKENECL